MQIQLMKANDRLRVPDGRPALVKSSTPMPIIVRKSAPKRVVRPFPIYGEAPPQKQHILDNQVAGLSGLVVLFLQSSAFWGSVTLFLYHLLRVGYPILFFPPYATGQ
jgi:hypothetical protein